MIYFIQAATSGGPIKIGVTIDLKRRLKQIEKQTGWKLFVLGVMDGSYAEERILHLKFAPACIESEWFYESTEIREFIDTECRPWDGTAEVPSCVIIHLKGSPEYAAWLEEIHRETHIPKATIMRLALADWAAKNKHKVPPEL